MGDKTRTYDEVQIEAVRVTCLRCGKPWYMTRLGFICAVCRRKEGER